MNDEQRHLARGLMWLGSATALSRVIDALSTVFVLRFLTREEIGVATLAWSVAVFAESFNALGIGVAIQQRPELSDGQKSTAFWFATASALGVAGAIMLAADAIAGFYHEPSLAPLTRVAALKLVLVGLAAVPLALLARALRYKTLGAISTAATLVSSLVTLGCAASGLGAWAPVLGNLSNGAAQLLGASFLGERFSKRHFALAPLRPMIALGLNVSAGNAVVQLTRNLDYLLLGRLVSSQVLGSYRVAFELAMTPATAILQVANRAAFPVYASFRGDLARICASWSWTVRSVSLLLVPAVVLVYFDGVSLLSVLGKSGWPAAAWTLRILSIAAIARGVVETIPGIYIAAGKARLSLIHSLTNLALVAASMVALLSLLPQLDRVIAISVAWLLATLLLVGASLVVSRRAIGLSARALAQSFRAPIMVLAAVAGVLALARFIPAATPAQRLLVDTPLAILVYWGMLRGALGIRAGALLKPSATR